MRKDFKYDTWDSFNEATRGKKIVLFGASARAIFYVQNVKNLNSRWLIECIVDNDKKKQDTEFEGFIVKDPEILLQCKNDIIVLICSMHTGEIAEQLENYGIKNYFSNYWLNKYCKDTYRQDVPREEIRWLKEAVCDEESKTVIDGIVDHRKNDFLDYSDIKCFEDQSEYFIDEFWRPIGEQEVFVDGAVM